MTRAAVLALALAVPALGQTEPTSRPAPVLAADAYATLVRELEHRTDRSHRVVLLREFIAEYAPDDPDDPDLLTARCRLGTELLTAFDSAGALAAFTAVLEQAAEAQTDLRGRALYGVAQAHELAGSRRLARDALQHTLEGARGTRYARFAELARDRIDRDRALVIGSTAPEFGPRLDVDGKPRQLVDLARGPALVGFVSLADDDGLVALRDLVDAATRGGLEPHQIVLFASDATVAEMHAIAKREGWTMPVIECSREFVDPAAMLFAVRALPATFLIAPDGTLIAKDPTPARVEEIVRALR